MTHLTPDDRHLIGPRAQVTDGLLNVIQQALDLGDITQANDVGGTFNLNLRLRAAGSQQYIARVHRPWVEAARLETLYQVKQALRDTGIPTPIPLTTQAGRAWLRFDDRLIEVEPYVAHDGNCDSYERYQTAFALLAQLHDRLESRIDDSGFVPPRVANYAEPATLIDWVGRVSRQITDAEALALCQMTTAMLEVIGDWWQSAGNALPRRFTHGDYGGENLLFRGDELVTVLDLDFVARRERIFDIAYTLYWMLVRLHDDDMIQSDQLWRQAGTMIAVYDANAKHKLSADERAALPIEIARVPLYWVGAAIFVDDPAQEIRRNANGVRLAKWLLDQRSEMGDILFS